MMSQLLPDDSPQIQPWMVLADPAELNAIAKQDRDFEKRLVRVNCASKTFRGSNGMTASIPPGHQRTELRS